VFNVTHIFTNLNRFLISSFSNLARTDRHTHRHRLTDTGKDADKKYLLYLILGTQVITFNYSYYCLCGAGLRGTGYSWKLVVSFCMWSSLTTKICSCMRRPPAYRNSQVAGFAINPECVVARIAETIAVKPVESDIGSQSHSSADRFRSLTKTTVSCYTCI